MRKTPMPYEIYRHFKGNLYQIIAIAKHSETGEMLAVYQAMYGDFRIYARPLTMFMEKTDRVKYPDAAQEYRFELVDMAKSPADEVQASMKVNPAGAVQETVEESKADTRQESMGESRADIMQEPMKESNAEGFGLMEEKQADTMGQSMEEEAEKLNIDPMVLEFLDASTYAERLNILAGLHYRITDDMINVMAMATDIEIGQGDVEERYEQLRNCLMTLERFECNRLR